MQNKRKERIFLDPIFRNNPVTVQILGICSALAVTVKLQSAVVMALSLTFVVAFSNVIVSLLRKTIPGRIRIIVQLVVVAFLVIVVDQFLKAYFFDISKQLSVFVGLIITNCIVMGRLEAFAMSNSPKRSLIDGLANGLGYGFILIVVAFFRELLGSGTIWNYQVVPQSFYDAGYMNNGLMIMPPMALIAVGIIVWIQRAHQQRKEEGK
ncbi:MAG: NADH:ubiquinone reductase (Na(+)-transporting) subunit D [Bacteroidales bacterium]|nr:NADH:ubiquinone reductase (Na(+)-transporting) subunit D [Bacteroidales bacterium]